MKRVLGVLLIVSMIMTCVFGIVTTAETTGKPVTENLAESPRL